ncbi:pentapeptide repeat-containing protein [Streptomyces sp. DSM 15324]|uniref:pentapeptide repeat-containing protein n=1 Tax=Streptomyces sp. DSM 15324 TaxID=1739111 RepID=UPI00099E79E8|nr:pentapeptide repeat-containing protein [Streptomyces sp. DSM 15324]
MIPHPSRRRLERRGLRLWPVGLALGVTFTTAVLVAASVFFTGWGLLDAHGLKPERRIDSSTLFDLVKLSFGVVAGAGALVALVVAYRRQRVDEDGALREATRLHTERFTTAVSQLGAESPAVRLGGVHALAGLADDAPTRALRQTCIDVLCAYLRLPYTAEGDLPPGIPEARHTYRALREVRHTVIRLVRDHLRLQREHQHSWQGHDFDFTGVVFDGGDFSRADFGDSAARFTGATFAGDITFAGARFASGGTTDFTHTVFATGAADFGGSAFSGGVADFTGAEFRGGTVYFSGCVFTGGTVLFHGARFTGGTVSFSSTPSSTASADTEFSGATVDFGDAAFSAGRVVLDRVTVSRGLVTFAGAEFSGTRVGFDGTRFSGGTVNFTDTVFSAGTVKFTRTVFAGGTVAFDNAAFIGTLVDFGRRTVSGGTLDFTGARGTAPAGLLPSGGPQSPWPTGLTVPSVWRRTTPQSP